MLRARITGHVRSPPSELRQAQADRVRARDLARARAAGEGHRQRRAGARRRSLCRSARQISPSGLVEGGASGRARAAFPPMTTCRRHAEARRKLRIFGGASPKVGLAAMTWRSTGGNARTVSSRPAEVTVPLESAAAACTFRRRGASLAWSIPFVGPFSPSPSCRSSRRVSGSIISARSRPSGRWP